MRRLLVCLLVLPAAASDDVTSALEKKTGILTEKILFHWISAGLEPPREGHRRIVAGDERVRALPAERARALVGAADVVLVADLHQLDACRLAFRRIVEEFGPGREFALALEAIPVPMGEHLAQAREGADLLDFLRNCSPWPVRAYADLLRRPKLKKTPVLAVGVEKAVAVPPAETKDAERVPVWSGEAMTLEDFKYGASWHRRNTMTAGTITAWIGKQKGKRKVFVLYGAAHYLGENQIQAQLEQAGLKTVVLVPFLPAWELALRQRFGAEAGKRWYEVMPGILRAPFVRDAEIG